MFRFRTSAAGLVSAALLIPAGCSSPPPPITEVQGVVTINGQPVPRAEVRFVPMHPDLNAEYIAVGETDDEGRFTLTCKGRPGACACENQVTVAEGSLPAEYRGMSARAQAGAARYLAGLKNRPIPEQYGTLAQSPLSITVTTDRTTYDLELTR